MKEKIILWTRVPASLLDPAQNTVTYQLFMRCVDDDHRRSPIPRSANGEGEGKHDKQNMDAGEVDIIGSDPLPRAARHM